MKAACWGGPLDGLTVRSPRGTFGWFDSTGRSHRTPGVDSYLHQLSRDGYWRFVGHRAHRCSGCRSVVFVRTCDSCPLCGCREKP